MHFQYTVQAALPPPGWGGTIPGRTGGIPGIRTGGNPGIIPGKPALALVSSFGRLASRVVSSVSLPIIGEEVLYSHIEIINNGEKHIIIDIASLRLLITATLYPTEA